MVKKGYGWFASVLFEPWLNLFAKLFPKKYSKFVERINYSGLGVLPNEYLASMWLTSFLVFFISLALLVVLLFQYSIVYAFVIAIFVTFLVRIVFSLYPRFLIVKRRREMERELPFFVSLLFSFAKEGYSGERLFRPMYAYHEYRIEISRIFNYMNYANKSLGEALIETSNMIPSEKVKDFFVGMAIVVNNKTTMMKYLTDRASNYIVDYRLNKKVKKELFKETGDLFFKARFNMSLFLGIIISVVFLIIVFLLFFDFDMYTGPFYFYLLLITGVFIGFLPVIKFVHKKFKRDRVVDNAFFRFAEDLYKNGTNLNPKSYGILSKDVTKFISKHKKGVSLKTCFQTMAIDLNSELVTQVIRMALEDENKLLTRVYLITRPFVLRNKLRFEDEI
ncbi:MAG: hypothetical protein ABIJ18_00385 [archaeon]